MCLVAASGATLQVKLFGVKYYINRDIADNLLIRCISRSHDTRIPAFLLSFTHTEWNSYRIHPNSSIFVSTFSFSTRSTADVLLSLIDPSELSRYAPWLYGGGGHLQPVPFYTLLLDDIVLHVCVCVCVGHSYFYRFSRSCLMVFGCRFLHRVCSVRSRSNRYGSTSPIHKQHSSYISHKVFRYAHENMVLCLLFFTFVVASVTHY